MEASKIEKEIRKQKIKEMKPIFYRILLTQMRSGGKRLELELNSDGDVIITDGTPDSTVCQFYESIIKDLGYEVYSVSPDKIVIKWK